MNRRDFLKGSAAVAALSAVGLHGQAVSDGDKRSQVQKGPQVTRRNYKGTGMTLPLLGYGMMRMPMKDGKMDMDTCRKFVRRAMEAGINYFDTAYVYSGGKNEGMVGEVLSEYPRDSYYIATKLPIRMLKTEADVDRMFEEELKRLKTDYIDFYLMHNLNANEWKKVVELKVYDKLKKKQAEGKIRKLGFSFHDTPKVLKTIVNAYSWDFGQIQLNMMDWELSQAREQYEILTNAGIPVTVMEPLRGGALASLNDEAQKILKAAEPNDSVASWSFRFAASLPNVLVVLSGMQKLEHLEENIRTMAPLKELTDESRKTLEAAFMAYRKAGAIPCTGCRYCMPCPAGVEIPRIFGLFNQMKTGRGERQFLNAYGKMDPETRADACLQCEACMKKCPQKIAVPKELQKIDDFWRTHTKK